MIRSHLAATATGAVAFALVQLALLVRAGPPLEDSAGWFLNSGSNVSAICGAVVIAAAIVAAVRGASLVSAAMACLAGAIAAMTVVLVIIGPGTIFPIVIFIGGTMLAFSVAVGTATVEAVRRVGRLLSAR